MELLEYANNICIYIAYLSDELFSATALSASLCIFYLSKPLNGVFQIWLILPNLLQAYLPEKSSTVQSTLRKVILNKLKLENGNGNNQQSGQLTLTERFPCL